MTTATEITAGLPRATKAFARIEPLDWQEIGKNLDEQGNAVLAGVLTLQECKALASLYPNEDGFRSRVVMGRYGFGRGEYKYFSYPLPDIIEDIRTELYSRLAPLANKWNESMKIDVRYPATHAQFIKRCHDAGQERPTPLLLCATRIEPREHSPIAKKMSVSAPPARNVDGVMPRTALEVS